MIRRGLVIVGLVLAFLGAIALRGVLEGRAALARGDEAAARGELGAAISSWETAARWYVPAAPHVDLAYARLTELATKDHRSALAAWRATRSAALATRGLWSSHATELAAANSAIAELASRDPEGALAGGPDAATRKVWHTERLARDLRPSPGAVTLAVLGIAAFLAGLALALLRGLPAGKGPGIARRPALVGVALTVIGALAWTVGLYNA